MASRTAGAGGKGDSLVFSLMYCISCGCGTNHTLPTYGTARFSSALSVEDFVKKSQFV